MTLSLSDRLWYRLVQWWMYRHGAEDVTITLDGEEYTIPVYPLSVEQEMHLEAALRQWESSSGLNADILGALQSISYLVDGVAPVPAKELPTEVNLQILKKAPRESAEMVRRVRS